MPALTRALAFNVGSKCREGRVSTRNDIGSRYSGKARRVRVLANTRQNGRYGKRDRSVSGFVPVRAGLSTQGKADVNNVGLHRLERIVAEPDAFENTRAVILDPATGD